MKPEICLECGSYIPPGKIKLRGNYGEEFSLTPICPICYTPGKTGTLEELAKLESFQNFIEQLDRRVDPTT